MQQELLEKIKRKVGEKGMSELIERLRRENIEKQKREGRKEGKKESRKEIAKNMLNLKLDEKIVLEATKIEKEELEEIKNKLAKVG